MSLRSITKNALGTAANKVLTSTGWRTIVNADLAGSIAYSKLALTGAILNADLAGSIAYAKLALTGAILNADLAGSIAYSKLALTGALLNADMGFTWTSFNVTSVTQGATITGLTQSNRYLILGKLAIVHLQIVMGSAGTANNGIIITLPTSSPNLTSFTSGLTRTVGAFSFLDSGALWRVGSVTQPTTTTLKLQRNAGDVLGTTSDGTAHPNAPDAFFTIATNDIFSATIMFELA
jgi:hypothetical protein